MSQAIFRPMALPAFARVAKVDIEDGTHTILPIGSIYGIFSYIYLKNQPHVGTYTNPMDPMGNQNQHQHSCIQEIPNSPTSTRGDSAISHCSALPIVKSDFHDTVDGRTPAPPGMYKTL